MKRIAWLTDLHLNFVAPDEADRFWQTVAAAQPDAVLIGGDIDDSRGLPDSLRRIDQALSCPVYFVLGNHDYYHSSIAHMDQLAQQIAQQSNHLVALASAGVVELTPHTALIGHGGWADARLGNWEYSWVILNDYLLIDELTGLIRVERLRRQRELGDQAAAYVDNVLHSAVQQYRHTLFLTHVPPFKEACWHQGYISDPDYLPHFTCRAVGESLRSAMQPQPERDLLVLCGHSHGKGEAQILPNLRVLTGGAEYGQPCIQTMLLVE
jgi:predicted MPP superfamily phosphohydrolase